MRPNSSSVTSPTPPPETIRLGTPCDSLSSAQLHLVAALQKHEGQIKIAIWSYLRSFLGLERAAIESEWEDVWADVRERAIKEAHRYDPEKSVSAWLSAIAFNCVRDLTRKKRREVLAQDAPFSATEPGRARSESDVFDNLQEIQTPPSEANALFLEDLLPLVPKPYHEPLRLHFEQGLVGKSLAERLRLSEGAASVKLCRAKAALVAAHEKRLGLPRENHND